AAVGGAFAALGREHVDDEVDRADGAEGDGEAVAGLRVGDGLAHGSQGEGEPAVAATEPGGGASGPGGEDRARHVADEGEEVLQEAADDLRPEGRREVERAELVGLLDALGDLEESLQAGDLQGLLVRVLAPDVLEAGEEAGGGAEAHGEAR